MFALCFILSVRNIYFGLYPPSPFISLPKTLYEPLSFNVGFYGSSNIRESKVYERGTFLVKNVV